jgi:Homeodomain-like domain
MTETIRITCGPTNETTIREVYPVTEVARRLGVSKRHVWRMAKKWGFQIETVENVSCVDAETVDAHEVKRATEAKRTAVAA